MSEIPKEPPKSEQAPLPAEPGREGPERAQPEVEPRASFSERLSDATEACSELIKNDVGATFQDAKEAYAGVKNVLKKGWDGVKDRPFIAKIKISYSDRLMSAQAGRIEKKQKSIDESTGKQTGLRAEIEDIDKQYKDLARRFGKEGKLDPEIEKSMLTDKSFRQQSIDNLQKTVTQDTERLGKIKESRETYTQRRDAIISGAREYAEKKLAPLEAEKAGVENSMEEERLGIAACDKDLSVFSEEAKKLETELTGTKYDFAKKLIGGELKKIQDALVTAKADRDTAQARLDGLAVKKIEIEQQSKTWISQREEYITAKDKFIPKPAPAEMPTAPEAPAGGSGAETTSPGKKEAGPKSGPPAPEKAPAGASTEAETAPSPESEAGETPHTLEEYLNAWNRRYAKDWKISLSEAKGILGIKNFDRKEAIGDLEANVERLFKITKRANKQLKLTPRSFKAKSNVIARGLRHTRPGA